MPPIAEDFIMGTANGMSRFDKKIRIVVEGAEFADYFWPAMEQLVETSHDYWRSMVLFLQILRSGWLQAVILEADFITHKLLKVRLLHFPACVLFTHLMLTMLRDFYAPQ